MSTSTAPIRALAAAVALAALAGPTRAANAQAATVAPGMSRDEVVRVLGKPIGERTTGAHGYLFYRNGCEKTCGMSDVVTLENGAVVDAVFRSPSRHYSGTSSSPHATAPAAPRGGTPALVVRSDRATAAARPASARRNARGAASGITPTDEQATGPGGQTRALMVPPRRPSPSTLVGTDSGVAPRGLADTTTSTGTRFGPPLTVVPGPRTPQTPGLGAPASRDSSVRNGVPLPPGSVPVPFQGARPSSVDSARAVNEQRQRAPQPSPAQPARAPR